MAQWGNLLSQSAQLAADLRRPIAGEASSRPSSGPSFQAGPPVGAERSAFRIEARDPAQLREFTESLHERAQSSRFVHFSPSGDSSGIPSTTASSRSASAAIVPYSAEDADMGAGMESVLARTRAHSLLATKGFDAERLGRSLVEMNLRAKGPLTEEEGKAPRAEADLEGFLRDEHDRILLQTIEDTRRTTTAAFERAQEELIADDWESCKRVVIDQLQGRLPVSLQHGVGPRQRGGPTLQRNNLEPSQQLLHDASGQPTPAFALSGLAGQYAGVVHALYTHVLRQEPFPVVAALAGATIAAQHSAGLAQTREAARLSGMEQCWDMLCEIVDENGDAPHGAAAFLRSWNGLADDRAELLLRLLKGSQSFLEAQYAKYIQRTVRERPELAMVGPEPDESAMYRGFLRVVFQAGDGIWPSNLDIVDDIPVWACVYLCLRCGEAAQSLENLLTEIERAGGESILGNFSTYARSYVASLRAGHPLGLVDAHYSKRLFQDYRVLVSSNPSDPYLLLCYNIVGRIDWETSFSSVLSTTQDFVWYRLLRIRSGGLSATRPGSKEAGFSLEQFQETLRRHGADHFSHNGQNPLLYFQVLMLSCQFDEAVTYLSGLPQFHVEAAHVALAVYYYGLCDANLVVEDEGRSSLIAQQLREEARGNDPFREAGVLERAILAYAQALAAPGRGPTSTEHALEYLALIRDKDRRARSLALVLVQGDASTLQLILGDSAKETTGVFETLGFTRETSNEIVRLAAGAHELTGRHADAVMLYDFAGDAMRVWEILTSQLSRVLAQPSLEHTERDELADLAMQIYQAHKEAETPNRVAAETGDAAGVRSAWLTLELALNLVFFFDLYHANEPDRALQLIEELDLLPLRAPGDASDLQAKLDQFKTLDHAIRRNIGSVLVSTMDSLRLMLDAISARFPADPADTQSAIRFREQAKAVLSFSGLLAQRLPDDLQSRLMRLWVSMK